MITETDLNESNLTVKDIEKAAINSVKNSKLIMSSLIGITSYLLGLSIPEDLDEYKNVFIAKAVAENDMKEDEYRTFIEIPYGTSVIYNTNLLDEVCKSADIDELIILPSLTEEIICLPATSDVTEDIGFYKALIKKVNNEDLNYNTELSDKPYFYKMGGKVTKYEAELEWDIER